MDDTLCQSQEQAWLLQVKEVKTELSLLRGGDLGSPDQDFWQAVYYPGDLNPAMCTHVQILQAEPSVSVYLSTCQQYCRVKLEEISLQLPQKCGFLQALKCPKGWCYRSGKVEMT